MQKEVIFESLKKEEAILLLKTYDFDVDKNGHILTPQGNKVPSEEIPKKFLKIEDAAFIPGSLKVIDGTPTSISKFIRQKAVSSDVARD